MRLLEDIPTETFNQIIADLHSVGWATISEYDGMDAWIDYGNVVLEHNSLRLTFEWNNWWEGSVSGEDSLVIELKEKYGLKQMPQNDNNS